MGLPATGSISMAQVRDELGRTGAISFNDSTVRSLAGRTASGSEISMSHLRGKSAMEWNLPPSSVSDEGYSSSKVASASAGLRLKSNKTWVAEMENATNVTQSLFSSGSVPTVYYRVMSKSSNVTGSGASSSYTALTSDKVWELDISVFQSTDIDSGYVEIRYADNSSGTGSVLRRTNFNVFASAGGGGGDPGGIG